MELTEVRPNETRWEYRKLASKRYRCVMFVILCGACKSDYKARLMRWAQ